MTQELGMDCYDNFVDVSQKNTNETETETTKNDDLIPEECYVIEQNNDGSSKIVCKQCGKEFKSIKIPKNNVSSQSGAAPADTTDMLVDRLLVDSIDKNTPFNLDESVETLSMVK